MLNRELNMFLISSGIKEKLLEVPLYSLKFLFSFLEAFKSGSFLFLSYSSLFLLSDNISYASEIFLNFSEALSLSGFLSGWYLKANFLYFDFISSIFEFSETPKIS
jgi:hypothetical protein